MDIRTEAQKAVEMLPEWKRKLIGADADAVLRTAESLRTSDGLKDQAIPMALQQHGIITRNAKEQQAYREFLVNAFLFGDEALNLRKEKRQEGGLA